MDTDKHSHTYSHPDGTGSAEDLYFSGMERYACTERKNAEQLCIHAAFACCGITAGILLFLCMGEHEAPETVAISYLMQRAFTSYSSPKAYLSFLSGWFLHYERLLLAGLLPALTVCPRIAGRAVCLARGLLAGFGVCALSGAFSAFAVFYAAAQSGILALLLMMTVKAVRFAEERKKQFLACRGKPPLDRRFFLGALSPLLTGFFLLSAAVLVSQIAVSAAACFLI